MLYSSGRWHFVDGGVGGSDFRRPPNKVPGDGDFLSLSRYSNKEFKWLGTYVKITFTLGKMGFLSVRTTLLVVNKGEGVENHSFCVNVICTRTPVFYLNFVQMYINVIVFSAEMCHCVSLWCRQLMGVSETRLIEFRGYRYIEFTRKPAVRQSIRGALIPEYEVS